MPSDKPARRLEDLIKNAQAIQRSPRSSGTRKRTTVERCLERISEAAAKLGDLASSLVPGQHWQEIRALGNRLRHEYDSIREDRLWDIVQIDLPPLCSACEDALRRMRERQPD